jgi:hypothetical protein
LRKIQRGILNMLEGPGLELDRGAMHKVRTYERWDLFEPCPLYAKK